MLDGNLKKILFTSFTGCPTLNQGGPNNIIYKILKEIDYAKYQPRYISKNSDFLVDSAAMENIESNSQSLYFKNKLFRKAVSTPLYLRYHYFKGLRHFLTKNRSIEDDSIIHAHDVLSFYNFRKRKQKKILTIHSKGSIVSDFGDYHKKSSLLRSLVKRFKEIEMEAVLNADFVTFPSIAAKDLFLEEVFIQNKDKIRVVYNGINIENINAISQDSKFRVKQNENDIHIFNVADHIKVKNIEVILHTIKLLKDKFHKKIFFVNAGSGPLTKQLLELVTDLNIVENVQFVGNISNFEIIKLMKNCDYFISLSDRVIFDLVILEAMACGAVVIASNRGGNKEIIRNRENGYLIDVLEPENIVDVILNANNNCGIMAEKDIRKYSSAKMMKHYYELYNS